MSRRNTNPPSARGSGCRQAVGLLTRGSLFAAFPARRPVACGEEQLPLQRRDRPGFAPDSLTACRFGASLSWPLVAFPRALSLWLPVVAWAGLIFALSSVPDLGTGLGTWDLVLRKLAHAAEFAVLGLLLLRALGREPAAPRRWESRTRRATSSTSISCPAARARFSTSFWTRSASAVGVMAFKALSNQDRFLWIRTPPPGENPLKAARPHLVGSDPDRETRWFVTDSALDLVRQGRNVSGLCLESEG